MEYDGTFYAPIGDFMRESFNDFGFTKGTLREVDFLVDALHLEGGARILDVGCGTGRHSLELARRGYRVVGVDISSGMIEVARRQAAQEGLAAEFAVRDARDLAFDEEFDAAICLCEGAFGLAGSEEGHRRVLSGVARALKPDAPFVLTAINALSVARNLKLDASGRVEPTRTLGEHETVEFDPYTCTSRQFIEVRNPEEETRDVEIFTSAFTYRELAWLFRDAGFEVQGGFRPYSWSPIALDDIEIMVIGRLPGETRR